MLWSNFARAREVPHFNALARDDHWSPANITVSDISLKLHSLGNFPPQKVSVYLQPLLRTPPESHRIGEITVPLWPLRRSRSFKVTDFGTNRKVIYDFLLVFNSNLPPILHRFWDIPVNRSKSLYSATPLVFNSPDGGVPLRRSP